MYVWDDEWLAKHTEHALDPELAIVDPHHHLWDLPGLKPYLLEQLRGDTHGGHRIEATVFVECGWAYRDGGPAHLRPVGETEAVAAIAEAASSAGGAEAAAIVGFADLTLGDRVQETLDAHLEAGRGRFRGVRHATAFDPDPRIRRTHSRPTAGLMGTGEFRAGVRRLAAAGLGFDAWLYHPQIPELTELARAVPECTFVLDHLGGMLGIGPYEGRRDEILHRWRLDVAELARCPNVTMKLGGIGMVVFGLGFEHRPTPPSSEELAAAWRDPILFAIEQFGPDRCMFESNFPVDRVTCSYVTLWNAFKRITAGAGITGDERDALFRTTARHVYRLP